MDDDNLHSLARELIDLRIAHDALDGAVDGMVEQAPLDELALRRLKKQRLLLRDRIARLEAMLDPPQPA
jgi:hypothetical protein